MSKAESRGFVLIKCFANSNAAFFQPKAKIDRTGSQFSVAYTRMVLVRDKFSFTLLAHCILLCKGKAVIEDLSRSSIRFGDKISLLSKRILIISCMKAIIKNLRSCCSFKIVSNNSLKTGLKYSLDLLVCFKLLFLRVTYILSLTDEI